MALQGEDVLELVYDSLDDLAFSGCPTAVGFRPGSFGVVLGSRHNQSAIVLHPVALPRYGGEPFVRQEVGTMSILADKPIPYGALVGGGLGQAESGDDTLRAHRERYLEAVDPLGLGGTPPEGRLPAKQPFARMREALTLTMAGMRVVSNT
jgi:hypothetical protein